MERSSYAAGQKGRNHTPLVDQRKAQKRLLTVILVAGALLAGLWIWKAVQIGQVRRAAKSENESMRQQALLAIEQNTKAHLVLLGKTYAWAIRSALLQGNMDQVNWYLEELVKEKNFQEVDVVDPQGRVTASTNKKGEGKPLDNPQAVNALGLEQATLAPAGANRWMISSPVMGLTNRLGTVLIFYKPAEPALAQPQD